MPASLVGMSGPGVELTCAMYYPMPTVKPVQVLLCRYYIICGSMKGFPESNMLCTWPLD